MNKSLQFIFGFLLTILFFAISPSKINAQDHSVAREWNDVLLESIRSDFARPTVHARNLFHTSAAMYDAWAVYDTTINTYLLGKTVDGFTCPYELIDIPSDIQAAREETMSYVAYRILRQRFLNSPNAMDSYAAFDGLMDDLGYDKNFTSIDYSTNNPAALGNYIAQNYISFGLQDNSNEQYQYTNQFYVPLNPPLVTDLTGNPDILDPNRWQPLTLDVFIDQSGNPIPFNTPAFLSPEWGAVTPFALTEEDKTTYTRDGYQYQVYHDPGMPPLLDTLGNDPSENYKWGFALVSAWSSHLDPADGVMLDISPASIGNIQSYPTDINDYPSFYDLENGGDSSIGHPLNPSTGQPYETQMVSRADYARVLAEFWADGPDSETPPGHWFTLLNYVNDHPDFEKRYRGEGEIVDDLEWDIKAYFIMGGAMHDCAISAWGIKGWYDYPRPISAIRYMGDKGQSSDPSLANYHPAGLPLIPDFIEIVEAGDPLAGMNDENLGKIKVYAWKGPDFIADPATDIAGVDWILAEYWWPYQRPSFVTPPFAGYISGHSTYSSAAAEVMETITGDAFFPGGIGEFNATQNDFLVFEEGPSMDVVLQWATYKDASDQTSLSRIWGGIHPPADDIPGRFIGYDIGVATIDFAESYFLVDNDLDGFFSNVDCDDYDNTSYPTAIEICDGIDNDCDGVIDNGLPIITYYFDADNDGFGNIAITLDTCLSVPPIGYVANFDDCNDADENIHPDSPEICDNIDNNCNGLLNDGLERFIYYLDLDNDGYGDELYTIDTCIVNPPTGYTDNSIDCDDNNPDIYPSAEDIPDNGIDEDCSGVDYYQALQLFPNPATDRITIHYDYQGDVLFEIYDKDSKLVMNFPTTFIFNSLDLDLSHLSKGVYIMRLLHEDRKEVFVEKIILF